MNKLDYITRQFSRAEKKRFEHYVVTRIWHLLDDLSLKFVTQQCVTRPEGRALTDMFFPQLQIHIEIDEGHHKKRVEWDKLREADIINATGHEILRIDVTQDIEPINRAIDDAVIRLRDKQRKTSGFKAWDIDGERDPITYLAKGYIDLEDDVAFKTMADAASCFGKSYKGLQGGGNKHPKEPQKLIWFPKLYENKSWRNSISEDETEIREIKISELPERARDYIDQGRIGLQYRIVFARVRGPLGDTMYRFKGEYQLDRQATTYQQGLVWRRVSERVKTYPAD